jgi:hypothetical protein
MKFNYGYQNMPSDIIAMGDRYVLERVTNLKEGSCILRYISLNEVVSSYSSFEEGLKALAKKEYDEVLLDIKEHLFIYDKVREQ